MRFATLCLAVAGALAQTWYGIAPRYPPGTVDFFQVSPTGAPVRQIAIINTTDPEYVKDGTLHCEYGAAGNCYFLTGVDSDTEILDSLYTISKTGALISKFTLPQNVFVDNLALDWSVNPPTLYSVAFDPATRRAGIIDSTGGAQARLLLDISADVAGGFVFPGGVSICAQEHHLFVAVSVFRPTRNAFADFFLRYDVSLATPRLLNRFATNFPSPGGLRALCNASGLVDMAALTLWSAGEDRTDGLIGVVRDGPSGSGYFVPVAQSALPDRRDRFDPREVQLTGTFSEHAGIFVTTLYPEFIPRAPFGGFVWTVNFGTAPPTSTTTPSNFYLAGIAGTPDA